MKNKLIIETLIALAIFVAGVGAGIGATEIHHLRANDTCISCHGGYR